MGRSLSVDSMMTYTNIGLFGPLCSQSCQMFVTDCDCDGHLNSIVNFPNGFSKSCLCLLYFDTLCLVLSILGVLHSLRVDQGFCLV